AGNRPGLPRHPRRAGIVRTADRALPGQRKNRRYFISVSRLSEIKVVDLAFPCPMGFVLGCLVEQRSYFSTVGIDVMQRRFSWQRSKSKASLTGRFPSTT